MKEWKNGGVEDDHDVQDGELFVDAYQGVDAGVNTAQGAYRSPGRFSIYPKKPDQLNQSSVTFVNDISAVRPCGFGLSGRSVQALAVTSMIYGKPYNCYLPLCFSFRYRQVTVDMR